MLFATLLFVPACVVLMIVTTNLIGFVIRGLFPQSLPVDGSTDTVNAILAEEASRFYSANFVVTILAFGLTCSFVVALYHFWNVSLAVAASMLMVARVPDLYWEIQTGEKVSAHNMPKGIVHFVGGLLIWLAFPVVWYSLYVGAVQE